MVCAMYAETFCFQHCATAVALLRFKGLRNREMGYENNMFIVYFIANSHALCQNPMVENSLK